jgi:hypothetical protein
MTTLCVMKKERLFFLVEIFWEILRFSLLFYITVIIHFQTIHGNTNSLLWLVLLGSGTLLIPAGCFLLYIDHVKYDVVIHLVRIGKVLGLFTSFLIIIKELFIDINLFKTGVIAFLVNSYLLIILIGIFFDLIFLYFLLSFKRRSGETLVVNSENDEKRLPEFSETIVENVDKEKGEPE